MEIIRRELALPPDGYRTDDRLKEIHYGHWEGRCWDELPEIDPKASPRAKPMPGTGSPRRRKLGACCRTRVASWLAEFEQRHVVVAHGGVSRVLRGLVLGSRQRDSALTCRRTRCWWSSAGSVRWL